MLTLDPVPLALELHNQRPWDHHWVELFPSCSSHLLLSLSYPNVRRNFCLLTSVEMHSHEELVQVKSTYTFRQGWAWVILILALWQYLKKIDTVLLRRLYIPGQLSIQQDSEMMELQVSTGDSREGFWHSRALSHSWYLVSIRQKEYFVTFQDLPKANEYQTQ